MTKSNAQKAFEKIKKAQLKPRSALSVLAEQLGYAAILIFVFLVLVIGVNWIGFWLRASGNTVFLNHGLPGVGAFILVFPLGLIALLVTAFAITLLILRHYDISYKQPFLLLAAIVLLGAIILGAGLAQTGINERIAKRVASGEFSPLKSIYGGKDLSHSHLTSRSMVGEIEEIINSHPIIYIRDQKITVETNNKTRIIGGSLEEGKVVHVLGRRLDETTFYARIIIVNPPPPPPGRIPK